MRVTRISSPRRRLFSQKVRLRLNAALLTERIAIARPRTETGNYRARPLK